MVTGNQNGNNSVKTVSPSVMPIVYEYTDFRKFLRDYYEYRKASHRGFSFRNFSRVAGFSSPNFLKLVMDGQRNLSVKATEQIISALKISDVAAKYFRALIGMNQAQSDEDRAAFFAKLKMLTPHAHKRHLSIESVEYLSHWIYPVLREMVMLPEFQEDPYWIARRLSCPVGAPDVASALNFLIKSGFLVRRDDGRLVPKDQIVITSDEVRSLAIRNYHRQMLHQAEFVLESMPMELREFGALTLMLPEESMAELKSRLKAFRSQLHEWALSKVRDEMPDSVVQVNFQMYPHSRKVMGGRSE